MARPTMYVFDLDSTLWDGLQAYPDSKSILENLRTTGHYVYLASFNPFAPKILDMLDLQKFFHGGVYGTGQTKAQMIRGILHTHTTNGLLIPRRVFFFDDHPDNILEVNNQPTQYVRAIHTPNGITWQHVPC